jgi:hypothetical protein
MGSLRSTGAAFHYAFEAGTTSIGTQMCFIHPGQDEAKQSIMTAFAIGIGKEVTIRMMRVTDSMLANDKLRMRANTARNLEELPSMEVVFDVRWCFIVFYIFH